MSVGKLGISKQLVAWKYQKVIQPNKEGLHALLVEQCANIWEKELMVMGKGICS